MNSTNKTVSTWTGSLYTANMIHKQIAERWGDEEAEKYNPQTNCLTFKQWIKQGYIVRKGEKALHSITFVEELNEKKEVVGKIRKHVNLFYEKQVIPIQKQLGRIKA